ncbi:hypothetical protein ACFWBH_33865 [Streptomyces sp. NPDC059999]|uniref:hypothetical protein n=1 Tax=Streptomyces sp. NPDC059999 TaxID=3347030 RepID=UPI0036CE44D3
MYHQTTRPPDHQTTIPGPDVEALARFGVTETVHLNATPAKGLYTFDYVRDGRRIDAAGAPWS